MHREFQEGIGQALTRVRLAGVLEHIFPPLTSNRNEDAENQALLASLAAQRDALPLIYPADQPSAGSAFTPVPVMTPSPIGQDTPVPWSGQ